MRRFRLVFWPVVCMGALPSLLSGIFLLGQFRIENFCGRRSAMVPDNLRWIRLHEWGRLGALVAALLVVGYAVAWAAQRRQNRALVTALGALLLGALAIAMWSGQVTPWRALAPMSTSLTSSGTAPIDDEEAGGADYCLQHLDELHRLRRSYWLHAGSGALALLLILALTDLAARWRSTSER